MELVIPYIEAVKRFPTQVNEIMKHLQKGKSKEKHRKPEELSWSFTWGIRAYAYSFGDIASGKAKKPKTPETPSEKLDDILERMSDVGLYGSIGRWGCVADTALLDIPEEIVKSYKQSFEPKVTPLHLLALPQLKVSNNGKMEELPILFGYKEKKGDAVKVVVSSDDVEILYTLKNDLALWSGGLYASFGERLKKALPGDSVSYRRKVFIKLSEDEIKDIAKNKYHFGLAIF